MNIRENWIFYAFGAFVLALLVLCVGLHSAAKRRCTQATGETRERIVYINNGFPIYDTDELYICPDGSKVWL